MEGFGMAHSALPMGSLFAQCTPSEASVVHELANRHGAGVIVTNKLRGGPSKPFIHALDDLRRKSENVPLCADLNQYSGSNRKYASAGITPEWIQDQRRRGMIPLADSGYLASGDFAGLEKILQQSHDLGCVALLPAPVDWLGDAELRGRLIDRVKHYGIPIALALEHKGDPLGTRRPVAGLIQLMKAEITMWLLRCDISTLGAVAFGAQAAAIGTRTELRHLYPLTPKRDDGKPSGRAAKTAAVVKDCLNYTSVNKIGEAFLVTSDSTLWHCQASCCGGRSMSWLAMERDPERQAVAAFRHSLESLFDVRDALLAGGGSPLDQQKSWFAKCANAQERGIEIQSEYRKWDIPGFIGAWRAMIIEHAPEAVVR